MAFDTTNPIWFQKLDAECRMCLPTLWQLHKEGAFAIHVGNMERGCRLVI